MRVRSTPRVDPNRGVYHCPCMSVEQALAGRQVVPEIIYRDQLDWRRPALENLHQHVRGHLCSGVEYVKKRVL